MPATETRPLSLGEKIRLLRENRGLSSTALASLSGVSYSNIYNFETGRTSPSIGTLLQIASALDCSLAEFDGVAIALDRRRKTLKSAGK